MAFVETIVRRDPWEVEPRLQYLSLTSSGLRRVRDVAILARANYSTANHALNAQGSVAYHDGLWCLRDEFVGEIWKRERPGGVEAIVNMEVWVRVAFSNVDRCCDINHVPQSISQKGVETERLCEGNLFGNLPTYVKQQSSIGIPLFYCMVDPDGRVELSRPTIINKSFGPCVERNFISSGRDDGEKLAKPLGGDDAVEMVPTISRKVA